MRNKFLVLVSCVFLGFMGIGLLGSTVGPAVYYTIQSAGTAVAREGILNFVNGGCVDNAAQHRTDCTIAGTTNYSQSFVSQTSVTLTHNLNSTAVVSACYSTGGALQIIPNTTTITDANNVTVTFSIAQSGYCVVNANASGGGGGGGGSTVLSGTYGNLSGTTPTSGNMYLFTDSAYEYAIGNGSSWNPFFQGHSMTSPTGFAWQNQSTATLTTTYGGEIILSAVGASTSNWNGRYVAYPGTPFTRTFCLIINPLFVNNSINPSNAYGGLYISDGTQVEGFGVYGLSQMAVQYGPSPTNITTNVIAPIYTGLLNRAIWLRFDDGVTLAGNRTFSYSFDGSVFTVFWQESNTQRLTPTQIGYFASAFDTSSQTKVWALNYN